MKINPLIPKQLMLYYSDEEAWHPATKNVTVYELENIFIVEAELDMDDFNVTYFGSYEEAVEYANWLTEGWTHIFTLDNNNVEVKIKGPGKI